MDSNTDMPLLIIILKSSKAVRRIKTVALTSTVVVILRAKDFTACFQSLCSVYVF